MSLSVVYDLGQYDHEIEKDIPTLELAEALVKTLQPFHDKPLQIKEMLKVRRVRLCVATDLLYSMIVDPEPGQ
jgi:hypothetical protein